MSPPAVLLPSGRESAGFALPEFLYHGTSTLYLDQILREGLLPCTMTGEEDMTCLADDPSVAAWHAMCQSEFEESPPVVFVIPMGCFDETKFRLEDNFVRLGPSAGRGLEANRLMGDEAWEGLPWTWRGMLESCGAVGYTGPIPVTAAMTVRSGAEEGLVRGCEALAAGVAMRPAA